MKKHMTMAVVLAMASLAPAAIMIDCSANVTGDVSPASDENYWNTISAPNTPVLDLVDDEGNTTSVDFTSAGWSYQYSTSYTEHLYPEVCAFDGFKKVGAGATVTLSSLPDSAYDIIIYALDASPNGLPTPTAWANVSVVIGDETLGPLWYGKNEGTTLTFENVAPTDGEILMTFNSTGTGMVSTIVLEAVPEPATMGLLGVGALAFLRRRRR